MIAHPRFGVNYVPSKNWWYSWVDWDPASIRADLDAIADLGCDHIRIQCVWTLFQPNPNWVSPLMLRRTRELVDIADAAGVDVIVTVLDGWLSGFDFRPSWLGATGNVFTDRACIDAEKLLLAEVARAIGDHPRFLGFDVANEPNVLSTATQNPTSGDEGGQWVQELLAHCESIAPGRLHSVGVDHKPWLTDETAFNRTTLARTGSLTPIHAWSFFTGAFDRYGESGTGSIHLAEFMLELAKAHHEDPTRTVWLQEVGVSTEWVSRTTTAEFAGAALRAAVTVDDLWGVTWWCSHDVPDHLTGFADLEYDLGLLDIRNTVKPTGAEFSRVIAEVRSGSLAPVSRETALLLPRSVTPDLEFADDFFRMLDRGVSPAIVLEDRAQDAAHLHARGITEVLPSRGIPPLSA